jgi:hypothetical protein
LILGDAISVSKAGSGFVPPMVMSSPVRSRFKQGHFGTCEHFFS